MELPGKLKLESKVEKRVFHRCSHCNSEWPASAETCRRCAIWLGWTPQSEEVKWYLPTIGISILPRGLSSGIYEVTVITVAVCHSIDAMPSECPNFLIKAAGKILDLGGMLTRGPGGHLAGCFHGKNLMEAADRAVRCGLAVQSEPEKYGRRTFVGVNTGPVLVETHKPGEKGKISGEAMACSAAVGFSLHPRMVILSPATFRLVASRFDCYGTVPVGLWGKYQDAPQNVYVVTGPKRATSWGKRLDEDSGPFVGRDEELGLLRQCWGETKSGERPEGLSLHLVGEPGSGKSKLLQAFLSGLKQDDSQATVIKLAGSNYGGQPGLLLQEFMAECAKEGIAPVKVVHRLPRAGDKTFPTRSRGTLAARIQLASQLLAELQSRGPALVLIDDLNWGDRESILAFGKAWVALPAGFMILASYRPSGAKLAKFLTGRNTKRILLGPLSELEARQISQFHSLQGKGISRSLWRQIWEKSEGNPLYVEEATKFILARGEASRGDLNLPRTRAGLILARIKEWSEHELAELRSELRLRWGGSLQSRLSTFETQINDWLDRLETQRYLERAELAECLEELERFQSRIVELCLVGSLARPLTTRLGEAISRLYEGSYRDHYRYLLRSSKVPENRSWVGNQASQAAKRAVDRGRLREAVRFFRVAEKMLPSDHPLQKDLLKNAGDANLMLGRAGEAARLYEKAVSQNGISNPHDDAVHRLLAAQIFNGQPPEVTSFEWRNEGCPWHLIWMSLGALLAKKSDTAVSIAEKGKAASPDWVTRSYAGLVGALAQLAKGNPGDTFARCADVSRGMRAGGLSVLSLGLHWLLSQVTEGPSRSRHAATCRLIGKQLGLTSGLRAFLTAFDFGKGRGRALAAGRERNQTRGQGGSLAQSWALGNKRIAE